MIITPTTQNYKWIRFYKYNQEKQKYIEITNKRIEDIRQRIK